MADDGQGEGLEVVAALGDPRLRTLRVGEQGQVRARLLALEDARGDAVLFMDDDDLLLEPSYLYRAAQALNEGAELVYSGGLFLTPEGAFPYEPGPIGPWLLKDNRLLVSGTALPRQALEDVGSLDPSMGHYWDWDLWLRAYRAGLACFHLPGSNVGVRVHGGNQSYGRNSDERRRQDLEALMAKHGLKDLTVKDHLVILRENAISAT